MTPKPLWLLLDVNYIANRSYHALKGTLDDDGSGVGAIYGSLEMVLSLIDNFSTDRIVWCFDAPGTPNREILFPGYKQSRKQKSAEASPADRESKAAFRKQLYRFSQSLQKHELSVLSEPGLEADDFVAQAAAEVFARGEEAVMVSGDEDLFQCLRGTQIVQYRHGAKQPIMDAAGLAREYFGLTPQHWHRVKAIAGCKSDNIPGVPGVAEITASKFLTNQLPTKHHKYDAIAEALPECKKRAPLVKLPWAGTPGPDFGCGVDALPKLQMLYKEWGFAWQRSR